MAQKIGLRMHEPDGVPRENAGYAKEAKCTPAVRRLHYSVFISETASYICVVRQHGLQVHLQSVLDP